MAFGDLLTGLALVNETTTGAVNAEFDRYARALERFASGYKVLRRADYKSGKTFATYVMDCAEWAFDRDFILGDDMRCLYSLSPLIADDEEVRRQRLKYQRADLSDDELYEAHRAHRELIAAVDSYDALPTVNATRLVGKALGFLIWVVRCNLTHSEKIPYGPIPDKAQRDMRVLSVAFPVLKDVVFRSLDEPRRRLAVYGTLRRGHPNHALIDDLGEPRVATIQGTVVEEGGYPMFTWTSPSGEILVEIYTSEALTEERWADLDQFEGSAYQRILVPARLEDGTHEVVHVYSRRSF